MEILLIAIAIVFAVLYVKQKNSGAAAPKAAPELKDPEEAAVKEKLPIAGAYQKKWLLTYNEKDAYKVLKTICDENGLYLMTKVRLLDLVEPVRGNPKYKTYFYKVQAKHIDFVICDAKLVARCLVELDDNSHNAADRAARDSFVDEVVQSVGYKIIHTRGISEAVKAEILASM